jgi:hypothetical protein
LGALLAGFMTISSDKNLITLVKCVAFCLDALLSTPFPDISAASWPILVFVALQSEYDKVYCLTQSTALASFCVSIFVDVISD